MPVAFPPIGIRSDDILADVRGTGVACGKFYKTGESGDGVVRRWVKKKAKSSPGFLMLIVLIKCAVRETLKESKFSRKGRSGRLRE